MGQMTGVGSGQTFESLLSVATCATSFHLVTSHASDPSKSFTLETGSLARSFANSAGGSGPEARLKGKLGGPAFDGCLAVVPGSTFIVLLCPLAVVKMVRGRTVE